MESAKKQMLSEIKRIIENNTEIEDLQIDHLQKSNDSRISNKDLYKLYIGFCEIQEVQPRIRYSGRNIYSKESEEYEEESYVEIEC